MKRDELRIDDLEKKLATLKSAIADSDEHLSSIDSALTARRAEVDALAERVSIVESRLDEMVDSLGRLIEQERRYRGLPTRDQLAPQKVPGPGWANPVEPGA
jgi:chromosome segregation ATPase